MAYPYGFSFLGNDMGGAQGLRLPDYQYVDPMTRAQQMGNLQVPESMMNGAPDMKISDGTPITNDSLTPNVANPAYMLVANNLLKQSQQQQHMTPVQNMMPQGRNVTYRDVMRMYGINGLME